MTVYTAVKIVVGILLIHGVFFLFQAETIDDLQYGDLDEVDWASLPLGPIPSAPFWFSSIYVVVLGLFIVAAAADALPFIN